jgi:dephospho-CoA kinase
VQNPLQIGITGGIGSGKSLVCRIFATLGVPVYDADHRAKSIMTTDGILMSQITKEFGDLSYDEKGNLNRAFLASTVFGDPVQLERLNALVHPRVGEDYQLWYEEKKYQSPYVLKEAALLFESGSFRQLDQVVVIFAPVTLRIRRVQQRDLHRTPEQIDDIVKRQWTDEEKMKRADHIITNDESVLLIPQVISLHQRFLEEPI